MASPCPSPSPSHTSPTLSPSFHSPPPLCSSGLQNYSQPPHPLLSSTRFIPLSSHATCFLEFSLSSSPILFWKRHRFDTFLKTLHLPWRSTPAVHHQLHSCWDLLHWWKTRLAYPSLFYLRLLWWKWEFYASIQHSFHPHFSIIGDQNWTLKLILLFQILFSFCSSLFNLHQENDLYLLISLTLSNLISNLSINQIMYNSFQPNPPLNLISNSTHG